MAVSIEPESEQEFRPTWDQVSRALQRHMASKGEWAGCPVPIEGLRLSIESRNPYKAQLEALIFPAGGAEVHSCSTSDVDETISMRNEWISRRARKHVFVFNQDGRVKFATMPFKPEMDKLDFMLQGLSATWAYDIGAEYKAQEKLLELIGEDRFRYYAFTGLFLESSKRSKVMYIFRRGRPTVAIKAAPNGDHMKVLAALCLHPIAYYQGTYAGSMVPTDDVIAHLMLMRGDEHMFWRRANQHPLWRAEAGI